jgi:hypothetical protein
MADETPVADKEFENLKMKVLVELAQMNLEFWRKDLALVGSVQRIVDAIGKAIEEQGDKLFESGNEIDINALKAAFKARSESGGPGDVTGSDIVGGGIGWLEDLGNFIEKVGDFIKFEKKTFLAILLLIFCKDCHCVCEFINKPD